LKEKSQKAGNEEFSAYQSGVAWAGYDEAVNLIAWHFGRDIGDARPNLSVLPKPLASTIPVGLSGVRVAHFGFSFQVPWKDVEQDRVAW
jgi:hypothetical protein